MKIITLHESPSMCWYRINTERRKHQNLPTRSPSADEKARWKESCIQNKEGARRIYLALRQTIFYKETETEDIETMLSIHNMEKTMWPWMDEIFGDLY